MMDAQSAWQSGVTKGVLESLRQTTPGANAEDLRGFEWHYWDRLVHSAVWDRKGHDLEVNCVRFSSDGKWLATGSDDKTVIVWDAASGRIIHTLGHDAPVNAVACSARGAYAASGDGHGRLVVWDATRFTKTSTLDHGGAISCIAFRPDGEYLVSAGADGTIKEWYPERDANEPVIRWNGHTGPINSLTYAPDGFGLASAGADQTVRLWNLKKSSVAPTIPEKVWPESRAINGTAFSPDGNWLEWAGDDGKITIRGTTTETARTLFGHIATVNDVSFSPDGMLLASAGDDELVKLWRAENDDWQLLRSYRGHTGPVKSVAFSPDGKQIASASADATIKVWDATKDQDAANALDEPISNGIQHKQRIRSVAFGTEGRIASASDDDTVKLWKYPAEDRGLERVSLAINRNNPSHAVALSSDGRRLALAGKATAISIWTLLNGEREV